MALCLVCYDTAAAVRRRGTIRAERLVFDGFISTRSDLAVRAVSVWPDLLSALLLLERVGTAQHAPLQRIQMVRCAALPWGGVHSCERDEKAK